METINHECYVSLEVAKLLKEVGFNWECKKIHFKTGWKGNDDIWEIEDNKKKTNLVLELDYCLLAPTLDLAQRWLREVKNISIEVKTRRWVNRYQDGKYTVSYTHKLWPIDTSIVPNEEDKFICYTIDFACNIEFKTYEEALEAGIKKCLEIILNHESRTL